MNRSQLKKSLRSAVLQTTPDILPRLLPDYPAENLRKICPPAAPAGRYRARFACVMAAVCLLFLGVFYLVQPKVDSLVSIDVNPSIELTVDQRDRVIDSIASNQDAADILKNLNLKNKDLKEATDQIISEMIRTGYLNAGSTDNTILISVANSNVQKTEQLQDKITDTIQNVLKENKAGAKVLRQTDTLSEDLQNFARENGVSVGKADFVRKLIQKDRSLDAKALCKMSVKELTALAAQKKLDLSGVVVEEDGTAVNASSQREKGTSQSGPSGSSAASSVTPADPPSGEKSEGEEEEEGGSQVRKGSKPSKPKPGSHGGESSSEVESSEPAQSDPEDVYPPDVPPDLDDDPDEPPPVSFGSSEASGGESGKTSASSDSQAASSSRTSSSASGGSASSKASK